MGNKKSKTLLLELFSFLEFNLDMVKLQIFALLLTLHVSYLKIKIQDFYLHYPIRITFSVESKFTFRAWKSPQFCFISLVLAK